jgi:hypothetical protein
MKNIFEMAKIISKYSHEEALRRYGVCRDRFTDNNRTPTQNFDFLMEASMLLQRITDFAKEEVKSEAIANEPDINSDVWIQVPKGDDMRYWLNEYGQRIWNLRDTTKSAIRSYYWCDRIIILDKMRTVLEDIKFSDFIRDIYGNDDWIPEIPEIK